MDPVIISHRHKYIFIHIPKTGGDSVSKTLEATADKYYGWSWLERRAKNLYAKHLQATQIQDYLSWTDNDIWDSYFKFAFFRNPWERMVSWYHFDRENRTDKTKSHPTFDRWLRRKNGSRQVDYVTSKDGELAIDFVGNLDNFDRDFSAVCDQIGVSGLQLGHLNRSAHNNYRQYYDDVGREFVAHRYAADVAWFDYRF